MSEENDQTSAPPLNTSKESDTGSNRQLEAHGSGGCSVVQQAQVSSLTVSTENLQKGFL